tara:strand:- start:465 stop:731 length:267 start_codon:yes stop_codon:yes gene_type:complete
MVFHSCDFISSVIISRCFYDYIDVIKLAIMPIKEREDYMSKKSKTKITEKELKEALFKEVCKDHEAETDQEKSSVQKWFDDHVIVVVD